MSSKDMLWNCPETRKQLARDPMQPWARLKLTHHCQHGEHGDCGPSPLYPEACAWCECPCHTMHVDPKLAGVILRQLAVIREAELDCQTSRRQLYEQKEALDAASERYCQERMQQGYRESKKIGREWKGGAK